MEKLAEPQTKTLSGKKSKPTPKPMPQQKEKHLQKERKSDLLKVIKKS